MTTKLERIAVGGKLRSLLAAVTAAAVLFGTVTAWACPRGYVSCGERNQLCCPTR